MASRPWRSAVPWLFRTLVWLNLRRVVTVALTPAMFSYKTGHLSSAVRLRAEDASGKPLPWYSYPAIDFLRARDYSKASVLEFGGGQSTLWWAARASTVVTLERDPRWCGYLSKRTPANVALHLIGDANASKSIVAGTTFDIIVIDGDDRYDSAEFSPGLLAPRGAIILDNADVNWGTKHKPKTAQGMQYGIIDLFRDAGWSRVDFFGHAPGVLLPECTSIFFKGDCFLFDGAQLMPVKLVEAGMPPRGYAALYDPVAQKGRSQPR